MINTALIAMFWSKQPFFVSIHNGARPGHLARREVSVQVRARRLREHEVVRGVAGAHPPFGPDHLRYVEPGCALVGTRPALQQPSRKTQDTPPLVVPCLRCGSFLCHKSVCGRGCGQQPRLVQTAVFCVDPRWSTSTASCSSTSTASCSTRSFCTGTRNFSPCPSCRRGESLVGVRVHQSCRFVCFPQSLVIACVFPQSLVIALYFRRVSSLHCISVFFFLPSQHAHAVFARISVHESPNPQFFKRTHHKDRRQQQLFQRLAVHDRTASDVCSRSRHICSISFCLYVPTERDKYIWLVQSRRRPEKWTRTRKRQCNARPSFLITCCV